MGNYRAALAAIATAAALVGLSAPAGAQPTSPTYHGDNARNGNDTSEPPFPLCKGRGRRRWAERCTASRW